MKEMARKSGVEDRIIWAGVVEDPPAVMNAIDILAHACDIEGFPRVVLEAMAAGKPAVGPCAGGFAEGFGSGGGLLVEPGSADQLAQGIRELLKDPQRSGRLGADGRRRVVENFSTMHHLAKMIEVYRSAYETFARNAIETV